MKFINKLKISCLLMACFTFQIEAQELKFITIDVAPWAYFDKDSNKFVGIFPELVEEIHKRRPYEIEVSLSPYVRVNKELDSGRHDCKVLKIDEKWQNVVVGELIYEMPVGVVPSKKITLKSYQDLHGFTISVLRALLITEQFNNDPDIYKEFDTSYEMGLRKIQRGRLDGIAGAIPTIQALAEKNNQSHMLGSPILLRAEPIYLQCSKTSENLSYFDDLNQVVREIKEDGTLEKIISHYYK